MGFSRFGGGAGGKKGPRAHNGSFKNKAKLRPQPQQPFQDASKQPTAAKKGKGKAAPEPEPETEADQADDEDEDEEDRFGYRENLRPETKPLAGLVVSVTGCADVKNSLLETARELGARSETALTAETTHLVADGPGTRKFDVAIQHEMNVMSREWLPAIRDAWMSAEPTDFAALELQHVLPPFASLVLCVTGFARGEHKDHFRELLATHGAIVSTSLTADTTHLIVASPNSPHSQENHSKIAEALKHDTIKIVWEGWAHEVIEYKGVRSEREKVWEWRAGRGEPSGDEVNEVDVRKASKNGIARHDTLDAGEATSGAGRAEGEAEGSRAVRPRRAETDQSSETVVVANRKAKSRVRTNEISAVEDLLSDYKNPDGAPRQPRTSTSATTASQTSKSRLAEPLEMELAEDTSFFIAKGKSVITAVTTSSRSKVVIDSSRPTPFAPVPKRSHTPATAADDSAYFEHNDPPPTSADNPETLTPARTESWCQDPIFFGATFSLVGLAGRSETVKKAITDRAGTVWVEEKQDDVNWVVAPIFGAADKYRASQDPQLVARLVNHLWIEKCIFEETIVDPAQHIFGRPLSYDVPVPGGSSLRVNISSFSAVDATHVKYLVLQLGGIVNDSFDRKCSHLIHSAIDTDEEPEGLKVMKAREWGIPVVGAKWLRDWGQEQADARDAEVCKAGALVKGKGKAVPQQSIRRASQVAKPASEEVEGPLAGCVIAFSSKVDCDRSALGEVAESLGAVVAKSYSSAVTHLVHAGTKTTETFKEFKTRPSQLAIVHPRWIEECAKSYTHASEGDFPYRYDPKKGGQLVGMVTSPPRATRTSRAGSTTSARHASSQSLPPPTSTRRRNESRPVDDPRPPVDLALEVQPPEPHEQPTQGGFEYFSPPRSKESDHEEETEPVLDRTAPSTPAPEDEQPEDSEVHPPPVNSSSSPAQPQRPDLDTSSDPTDEQLPQKPEPTRNQLLKEQTSALLATLERATTADPGTKRKARMNRKKSAGESFDGSNTSDYSVLPPASNVPRRLPGMGMEATQFSQADEYSLDVTYEDPAAARARQQILAALSNSNSPVVAGQISPGPGGKEDKGRKRAVVEIEDEDENEVDIVEQPAKKRKTPARRKR